MRTRFEKRPLWAQWLIRSREAAGPGLSQKQFAAKHGLNNTRLSQIENGSANPGDSTGPKLANALGMTTEAFFDKIKTLKQQQTRRRLTDSFNKQTPEPL